MQANCTRASLYYERFWHKKFHHHFAFDFLTMASSSFTESSSLNEPWIQREFQKDKLRVRERYWRPLSSKDCSLLGSTRSSWVVIPDGVTWRRYLPLLTHLIEEQGKQRRERENAESNPYSINWIMLESAVELMDWRNVSPSVQQESSGQIFAAREAAAPKERAKLLKLLQDQATNFIWPFCDLSVREMDFDEWEFLNYPSMSIKERSKQALLRAGKIFRGHCNQANPRVVVIMDDNDENGDLRRQVGDEVLTMNMEAFLNFTGQHNLITSEVQRGKLHELKIRCEEEYLRRNKIQIGNNVDGGNADAVDEYLSEVEVQRGLKNGELVRGRLEVTKQNPKEAFVATKESQYFVNQHLGHFNRAFHGDVVILRPLPRSEWGRPIGRRKLVHNTDEDGDDAIYSNENIPAVPSARVVAIATHSSRGRYVATLVEAPLHDDNAIILVPMDIRIPKIRVATRSWKKYLGRRLLVEIDGWERGSSYPHGRCAEILGPIGDLEVEIKCLLIENEIMLDPFSASAMACLPNQGALWTVPEEEIGQRRDLRKSHRIFSVDPPGCQDIDDTMHAKVLPNGDIEVGVHIADVTYFVPHESPLDIEAQKRGTTFYLVDRRFDMLPSLLSSDLCSLHGDVDRLAVSVIWTLSPDLETVRDVWYGRTVIHNCQAMTYDQAHNILHNKPPDDTNAPDPPPLTAGYRVDPKQIPVLKKDLTILRDLGRKLKKYREEVGGAVDLSSGDLGGELKFSLDPNGNPIAIKPKKELEIHNTIAEMMIFANGYVAAKIFKKFPDSALLRIHRTVEHSRLQELKDILDVGGLSLEGNSNMALANMLKKVEKAGPVVNSFIKSLATRAMSEAQYVSTGDRSEGWDLSHYGLGVDKYTHFTSPIRRYADVIVHKQLLAALFQEEIGLRDDSILAPVQSERSAVLSIPNSNVISIMAGEGLETNPDSPNEDGDVLDDDDDFLDALIEGASKQLALGGNQASTDGGHITGAVKGEESDRLVDSLVDGVADISVGADQVSKSDALRTAKGSSPSNDRRFQPYVGSEVSSIADSLNRQNRMAKLSSMECQKLFLSLYFRDHTETAQAVVTNLRVNGFFVYIPEYDISGPVYLRDSNGDIQIDPSFFGLPQSSGQPPTLGFTSSPTCRRFTKGKCELIEESNSLEDSTRLEVSVAGGKRSFTVRTVDVVMVALSCDDWDVRSRVPPPRMQLVSRASRPPPGFRQATTGGKKITSKVLRDTDNSAKRMAANSGQQTANSPDASHSVFDVLHSLEVRSILQDVPIRSKNRSATTDIARQEEFKGRLVFGNFANPDTRSATQEAAISAASEAAAQRRANAIQTVNRRDEYDTVRNIERNVMARTQKLSAEKRNARKSKAK